MQNLLEGIILSRALADAEFARGDNFYLEV